MISKAQVKDIKALHLPKFRQIYNKFIAEGDKVCFEFLKSSKYVIDAIYIVEGSVPKYQHLISNLSTDIQVISTREMDQISALKTPSDVLLLLERKEDSIGVLQNNAISAIYLDGVQDPGNVGTIIRLADWFGIEAVIRSNDTADFFHPKVVQAAMGSMVNCSLSTSSLSELLIYKRPIYGTYMDGVALQDRVIESNGILVLGSEGKGIKPENEHFIDTKIHIPGKSLKVAESLNVAIAAGIVCAAWKKI